MGVSALLTYINVYCTPPGAFGGQKKALDPLEQECQMAVSHDVCAGNQVGSL